MPLDPLMGLTATFEKGIAVFVAIGTAGLAAIRSTKSEAALPFL